MPLNGKNGKKINPITIAEEFAEKGLIPEAYKDEFAANLERELRRETARFGGDVAGVVVSNIRFGRLVQGLAA